MMLIKLNHACTINEVWQSLNVLMCDSRAKSFLRLFHKSCKAILHISFQIKLDSVTISPKATALEWLSAAS